MHPIVIAELRQRLAQVELAAVRLDYRIPGEGASRTAAKRYADYQRLTLIAQDYRALLAWAESRDA